MSKKKRTDQDLAAEREEAVLRACGWEPDPGSRGANEASSKRLLKEARAAGDLEARVAQAREALDLGGSDEAAEVLGQAVAAVELVKAREAKAAHDDAMAEARKALAAGDEARLQKALGAAIQAMPGSVEAEGLRNGIRSRAEAWQHFKVVVLRLVRADLAARPREKAPPFHTAMIHAKPHLAGANTLDELRAMALVVRSDHVITCIEGISVAALENRRKRGPVRWALELAPFVEAAKREVLGTAFGGDDVGR